MMISGCNDNDVAKKFRVLDIKPVCHPAEDRSASRKAPAAQRQRHHCRTATPRIAAPSAKHVVMRHRVGYHPLDVISSLVFGNR